MSGTTTKRKVTSRAQSEERDQTVQINALCAAMDLLLAKLDADGGVTDTNYASTIGTGYAKIGDGNGTALTSTT